MEADKIKYITDKFTRFKDRKIIVTILNFFKSTPSPKSTCFKKVVMEIPNVKDGIYNKLMKNYKNNKKFYTTNKKLERFLNLFKNKNIDSTEYVIELVNYLKYLDKDYNYETYNYLLQLLKKYSFFKIKKNLKRFDDKFYDMKLENSIILKTIHSAKGSEFDYVFLPYSNHHKYFEINSEPEVEEEKRIYFVALTRARNRVYITSSMTPKQSYYNTLNYPVENQFLSIIDNKYFEKKDIINIDDDFVMPEVKYPRQSI